jgi:hypothetical protein
MPRTLAIATTLAILACSTACSSSSGGGVDAGVVDVAAPPELDVTVEDASDEEAESSPVYGCSQAQLAFATNMQCGQCVAQSCAALLKACTNCVECEMQLSGCPACTATCYARGAAAAFDAGP